MGWGGVGCSEVEWGGVGWVGGCVGECVGVGGSVKVRPEKTTTPIPTLEVAALKTNGNPNLLLMRLADFDFPPLSFERSPLVRVSGGTCRLLSAICFVILETPPTGHKGPLVFTLFAYLNLRKPPGQPKNIR